MAFGGWPAEALAFYAGLEDDNSKAYWTSKKAVYQEKVLRPMEELLEELAPEFGELTRYRAGVAGPDGAELAAVVDTLAAAGVEVHGHGTLKSAPRGYRTDHP